jgi:hypothetical protein
MELIQGLMREKKEYIIFIFYFGFIFWFYIKIRFTLIPKFHDNPTKTYI